jgi:tetratricopeptide (TPR) repeat protein
MQAKAKISEEFGRLLSGAINSIATYEGKTAPAVEEELGGLVGVTSASIQRYKSGRLPPEPRAMRVFAEAAVRRAFLDRRWLVKFLHAADYPNPDALLDALCPASPGRQMAERVLHNLPAPAYPRFIMREQPFREVIEALHQRAAVVVLSSLGGMGKTSLAREVASRCLESAPPGGAPPSGAPADGLDVPRFDGAVWVSDAERPGATTLAAVLDEIAHTLGYSGYAGYGPDEKRREVEQLLRRMRVLVVVDNFETVTDPALLAWLLKLPEPSKALITTREYRREFRRGAWPVEVRGMSEEEAHAFIAQRLHVLHMDRAAEDIRSFGPLLEVTGGNPLAIEMALGCLKRERRPLQEVVDDLRGARVDLFTELFQRSWALLDEAARRVLLSAALFAASADPDALAATADVRGATFIRAVERLTDLAYLDVLQPDLNQPARYALHPLVRSFADRELAGDRPFEESARPRWLNWHIHLASQVGYCRNNLSRLELLDPERGMLHTVLDWAVRHGRHAKVLALADGCGFYCYVRGLMNRQPDVNLAGAEAARALGLPLEEALHLSHHVQRLARAGNFAGVEAVLPRLRALVAAHPLRGESAVAYHHGLATYCLAQGRADEAEREWRGLLADSAPDDSSRLVTVRWLAACLRQKGQPAEARALLESALASAGPQANQRAVISLQLALAQVCLDQGDMPGAEARLADARAGVERGAVERHVPDVRMVEGRLCALRGDLAGARAAFAEAADRLERIGLRRELEEARQALAGLG